MISIFRLHTLPLSASGVILASFLSYQHINSIDITTYWTIFFLTLVTVCFLQILSNLANDLGDYKKGTDNESRLGPRRAIQNGEISLTAFKRILIIFIILPIISGLALIYISFESISNPNGLMMISLGGLSIIAAIKYTLGKGAYAYHGLGDIFVFIFFGLLSVCGTYFLMTGTLNWQILLPASSCGLLSTGVLNINNMRDIDNDKAYGKNTIAVRLGTRKSKHYHSLLIITAFILVLIYYIYINISCLYIFITLPLFLIHLRAIYIKNGSELNPQLKFLSLSTLAFCITVGYFVSKL